MDLVIAPSEELGRRVHAAMTAAYPGAAEPSCLPLPGCTAARPRPYRTPVVHHPARAEGGPMSPPYFEIAPVSQPGDGLLRRRAVTMAKFRSASTGTRPL
ncbi:MAG: hypothetical protein ACLTYN_14800 [Dysosmobacter welbionis]